MTILDNGTRNQYTASNLQKVFAYTFEIFVKEDIAVEQTDKATGVTTVLAEGTDYTVSGVTNENGGDITLIVGAATGDTLTLFRDMALERRTDFQQSGDFLAEDVNDDSDRHWAGLQQNSTNLSRAIRASVSDTILTSANTEIADVATRAGKTLGFSSTGALDYLAAGIPVGTFREYSTVAAMQIDTNIVLGDYIAVIDYATGNNSGNLFFVAVGAGTGTDDGGAFIDLPGSGLQAKQNFPRILSWKMYGAVGNGDGAGGGAVDTIPIQNCINRASVLKRSVHGPSGVYNFTRLWFNHDTVNNPGYTQELTSQINRIRGDGMVDEEALGQDNFVGTTLYQLSGSGSPLNLNQSSLSVDGRESDANLFEELSIIADTDQWIFESDQFKTHSKFDRVCLHNRNLAGGGVKITGRAFDFKFIDCLIMGSEDFIAVSPNIRARPGVFIDGEASQNMFDHCYSRGWEIGFHSAQGNPNLLFSRCVAIGNNHGFVAEVDFGTKSINFNNCHAELNTYDNYVVKPTEVNASTGGNIHFSDTNASSVVGLWLASTAYIVNAAKRNGLNFYRCTTAGTSAGLGGPTGTGTGIVDGSCVWDFISVIDVAETFSSIKLLPNSFNNFMKNATIENGYWTMLAGTNAIELVENGLLQPQITENRFVALEDGCTIVESAGSTVSGNGIFARNTMDGTGTFTLITDKDAFRYIENESQEAFTPTNTTNISSNNIALAGSKDFVNLTNSGAEDVETIATRPDGSQITVRLAANATFIHDETKIALPGNANVIGLTNDVFHFASDGTIWTMVGPKPGNLIGTVQSSATIAGLNASSGRTILPIDTSSNTVTIQGLSGGVEGRVVHIVKRSSSNNLVINDNDASGTQKIFTTDGSNITITGRGGVTLVFENSIWQVML